MFPRARRRRGWPGAPYPLVAPAPICAKYEDSATLVIGVGVCGFCVYVSGGLVLWVSGVVCTVPGMERVRVDMRLRVDLLGEVDLRRGDVSRTRWVERALEAALSGESADRAVSGSKADPALSKGPANVSAQPRMSVPVGRAELEARKAGRDSGAAVGGRPGKPFRPVPRS